MQMMFQTREFEDIVHVNAFFHTLTKEEQQQVLAIIKGIELGLKFAQNRQQESA